MVTLIDEDVANQSPFPILSYKQAIESPKEFITLLRAALLSSGFFYLSEIDQIIPSFELEKVNLFEDTKAFFELSEEEKGKIGMINSRHFRGWNTLGNELTQGKRDMREQIDFGLVFLVVPCCLMSLN